MLFCLTGADVSLKDDKGNTALHLCTMGQRSDVIQLVTRQIGANIC